MTCEFEVWSEKKGHMQKCGGAAAAKVKTDRKVNPWVYLCADHAAFVRSLKGLKVESVQAGGGDS